MMVLKVGINGFGRIGRVIFRTCLQNEDLEVTAINDPAVDIEYICYLIKFDSTHGKLKCKITFLENEITIEGNKVKVFSEKLPSNIPWQIASVQYVVEASGMFTNYEKASGHLSSQSVRRVLVTAPSVDVPMLIIGVNEDSIKKDDRIISCASSTLYCLAPIIKILEDNYHVMEGFITSIHAMTPSLKPLDGLCLRGKHWRDHRSIHQNIIPAATGACKALGKIIPAVKDKLTGLAFRVPIVNVSVLDITIRLNQNTSLQDIVECIDNESRSAMRNIIGLSYGEAVSSDFLGDEKSCTLDVKSSLQLTPNFIKLICWYENEYSYACRVVDSIRILDKVSKFELVSKMTFTKPIASERILNGQTIPCHNRDINMYSSNIMRNNSKICSSSGPNQSVRDPKQSNDIYKLWKDDERIINSPKHKTSLFQSCITFGPSNKERNNYLKNQELLEEVKKEFSRMVDMTQNLLKKSKESNIQLVSNTSIEDNTRREESTDDCSKAYSNSLSDNYYQTESYTLNDNVFDEHNKVKQIDKELTVKDQRILHECSNLNNYKPPHVKENVCFEENKCSLNNFEKSGKYLNIQKDLNDACFIKDDDPNDIIEFTRNFIENTVGLESTNNKKNTKINNPSTDEELEFHIALAHDNLETEHTETNNRNVINKKSDSTEIGATAIRKKILQGIIKKISNESSVETSRSPSPVNKNTTITAKGGINDIYDKLDSTSASDSENSFQINEKKSEVIEITDLTNSIQDLARLDKICRIIEISDELSDKLFSALGNNQDFVKKQWSFKDLCESIKLDDFCNKLFGQSSSE